MSFCARVFGWALEYLWIVLVFIILIKLYYICLIFKNNKLPIIHKYSNEILKPTFFLEIVVRLFCQVDYLQIQLCWKVKPQSLQITSMNPSVYLFIQIYTM